MIENATLRYGRTYTLMPIGPEMSNPILFRNGEPVPVTQEIREHLEQHATFDQEARYSDGRIERTKVCSFEFNPTSEQLDDQK